MARALTTACALVVLGALLAGCGGGTASSGGSAGGGAAQAAHYRAGPTRACLRRKGLSVSERNLGFVAATAPGGGLRTEVRGNPVVIAFADSSAGAEELVAGYRGFAPKKLQKVLGDIVEPEGNAVLLWGVSPSRDQKSVVVGCLMPGAAS